MRIFCGEWAADWYRGFIYGAILQTNCMGAGFGVGYRLFRLRPFMHALIIGYVWPEPASSAAGSRMLQLIAALQALGYGITFASPAADSEHAVDLSALGVSVAHITLNDSSFDAQLQAWQADLVLFDRFMMEEQFGWRVEKHCPSALRILDSEDLHFLRDARQQALKQQRPLMPADYLNAELCKREIAAIYRCDMTLVISPFELDFLQREFSIAADLLCYCPFMEETDTLPAVQDFISRAHFISIGNFRHAPNWDAVLELKRLWPSIRRELPAAEMHIYGAYPPPKATQLHNQKEGFLIKGWAEDASAVLSAARVLLAPLRFGAGIKGKLADAMRCGTPSVTTPVGAEGMQASRPWGGAVCEDDTAFITAAVALYQQPERWQQASSDGISNFMQLYAAPVHRAHLAARLSELHEHLAEQRSANFIGSMLRHHSMKSTQYMAQWIEAKNKLAKAQT